MSVRTAGFIVSFSLLSGCAATTTSSPDFKPYSSLYGMVTTCELDKVCDYTGEFKRQAATDPSIPDALYTYDNDKRCILIVTDKSGLERFEKEQENLNFEDDFLSIKGRAVKRESLQHWSKSSFCNDSDMALFMESIDPVFIMYHERP